MVATRSARFSRCVLRCQGRRSPSTALMLRAACSIPPIQTPNPSKNGPSSSKYPTVNHFRPKPIGGELADSCLIVDTTHRANILALSAQPAKATRLQRLKLHRTVEDGGQ